MAARVSRAPLAFSHRSAEPTPTTPPRTPARRQAQHGSRWRRLLETPPPSPERVSGFAPPRQALDMTGRARRDRPSGRSPRWPGLVPIQGRPMRSPPPRAASLSPESSGPVDSRGRSHRRSSSGENDVPDHRAKPVSKSTDCSGTAGRGRQPGDPPSGMQWCDPRSGNVDTTSSPTAWSPPMDRCSRSTTVSLRVDRPDADHAGIGSGIERVAAAVVPGARDHGHLRRIALATLRPWRTRSIVVGVAADRQVQHVDVGSSTGRRNRSCCQLDIGDEAEPVVIGGTEAGPEHSDVGVGAFGGDESCDERAVSVHLRRRIGERFGGTCRPISL